MNISNHTWQNTKVTQHMAELAIARKEGRSHESIDYVALVEADKAMNHKSMKSFVESYSRHKIRRMMMRR